MKTANLHSRPYNPEYFLLIASTVAIRSTCIRRKVGCVLTTEDFKILSTGYNGIVEGLPHCIDNPCPGANSPSGSDLDKCEAVHAEANALLQCPDVKKIEYAFITAFPCIHCIKLLANTSCKTIYYLDKYSHKLAYDLWLTKLERKAIRMDFLHNNAFFGAIKQFMNWKPE